MAILTTTEASCFASSYIEGAKQFVICCERIGAAVEELPHPAARGAGGEPLAIRVARIGDRDAPNVFLAICGTHGQEAFAGSATMLDWLMGEGARTVPPNVAVFFVHGLNPYGWAHFSRLNENGVDLNRNFMDHSKGHPENAVYDQLHDIFMPEGVDPIGLAKLFERLEKRREEIGKDVVTQAMLAGQYQHPTGKNYGGQTLEWSNRILKNLVADKLANAKRVAVIDWHTGLGNFGEPYFMSELDPEGDAYARAAHWCRDYPVHNDQRYSLARGMIVPAILDQLHRMNVVATGFIVEWGTYSMEAISGALFMDWWLRFRCRELDGAEAAGIRAQMMERFCPSVPEWRASVLAHARNIYASTIEGLKAWN